MQRHFLPGAWLAKAQRVYPHIAKLARKYLAVQASSTASERVLCRRTRGYEAQYPPEWRAAGSRHRCTKARNITSGRLTVDITTAEHCTICAGRENEGITYKLQGCNKL